MNDNLSPKSNRTAQGVKAYLGLSLEAQKKISPLIEPIAAKVITTLKCLSGRGFVSYSELANILGQTREYTEWFCREYLVHFDVYYIRDGVRLNKILTA